MRALRSSRSLRRPVRLAVEPLEARETPSTGGLLDPTFGSAGIVTTSWSTSARPKDVLVQPDGKLVIAGDSQSDFLIVRYNPNGALDTGFGSGGRAVTDFSRGTDTANAVALQPGTGGKLLAAGTAAAKTGDVFGLVRYNPNGTLDTTFGTKGRVTADLGPGADRPTSMAVQPDGRIILAGRAWVNGTWNLALARYTPNGALDPTFGSAGKLVTAIDMNSGYSAETPDVALQPDGQIVVSGSTDGVGLWVARFDANGSPDGTFGGTGRVTTDVPGRAAWAGGLALQPDGRLVVVGTSEDLSTGLFDVTLARYNADGSLDASFGSGGLEIVPTPQPAPDHPANRYGADVSVQADGRIVACGPMGDGTGASIGFAIRLNADGSVDTGYGTAGTGVVEVRVPGWSGADERAMTVQPDGKAVFAGVAAQGSSTALALVRLLPSAPQVGSFAASPNPGTAGDPVLLSATGLTDGNLGATVTQVAFYADTNGNGVLDAADALLGDGTDSNGAWTLTVSTAGWSAGTYTLFVQATDSLGAVGEPVGLSLELV